MQEGTIGRRYARALALAVVGDGGDAAQKAPALQKLDEELSALASLFQQKGDFREAMLNPSFSPEQRKAILTSLAEQNDLSSETRILLILLVEKDRIQQLPSIARAFREEVDERIGRVRAVITSARPLDDGTLKDVVRALEKKTGRAVLPEVTVDPSVISGVSARIGGIVFDATVRSQLDRLRTDLSSPST